MWHPRRLFTFGRQGEGAYLKKGGNQGQGAFFLITSRTCKTKLSCLFEKDFKKMETGLVVPILEPIRAIAANFSYVCSKCAITWT